MVQENMLRQAKQAESIWRSTGARLPDQDFSQKKKIKKLGTQGDP